MLEPYPEATHLVRLDDAEDAVRRAFAAGRAAAQPVPLSDLSACEACGHVQAEPNWCHKCRHRTTTPGWARALMDAERAAGRAAATPDPPTRTGNVPQVPVVFASNDDDSREAWKAAAEAEAEAGDEARREVARLRALLAASPDERLREALREIVADFPPTPDRDMDEEEIEQWYADHGDWFQRLVALAAADREENTDV